MSFPSVRSIALPLAALLAAAPANAASVSRGFNQLLDAVVRIDERSVAPDESSIGSGVVLTKDGLVLTNAHVAGPRAVEISVMLSSLERVDAKLIGWDHWTDLALLRLDMDQVHRRQLKFAHADFGDSDKLYPGETVYAVGTPYGLTRTVTRGIISNTNCYFEPDRGIDGFETGDFNTWLQTDAAINPGNSGGPLVTEDGRVVGITAREYLGANNLGFAIPATTAKRVVAGLLRDGAITRSSIGIVPGALRDFETFYALAIDTGMLINSVDPGSPAARAGLKAGDVLLAIDGQPVDARVPEQLPAIQNLIASEPVGTTLSLTVKSGPQTRVVSVVTERLESDVGEEWAIDDWGMSVRRVTRGYAREHELSDATGVLVTGIEPGYPADLAGLEVGDIVRRINLRPVTSLEVVKIAHAEYAAKPDRTLFEAERDRTVSLYILKP